MKRLIILITIITLISASAYADKGVDNNLEPLYEAKKINWGVQVDGIYPDTSAQFVYISEGRTDASLALTVDKPDNIEQAYLYIFTSGFNCPCEQWIVKFNGDLLVPSEHTDSIGPNPDGDGEPTKEKQTIRLPIDPASINDGSNTITFTGTEFDRKDQINIHGAVLVTFYEVPGNHEIWVYDGVEYLNHELVVDDSEYVVDLPSATYESGSKANLTVVLHSKEIPEDALYFNTAFLDDDQAKYLFNSNESSFLTAKRFDVSSFLDQNDLVNFTYQMYSPPGLPPRMYTGDYPLYPSLVILDVDLQDSTPPLVTFTKPLNNSIYSGNQSIDVEFTVDDVDASAALKIAGSPVTPVKVSDGVWTYSWDLSDEEPGIIDVVASATDGSGNTGSSTLTVEVTKPAPVVMITSPEDGADINNGSIVEISASVNDPAADVSIFIDGVNVANTSVYSWDTSNESLGVHTIMARAVDDLDQSGSQTITVTLIADDGVSNTSTTTTTIVDSTTTTGEVTTSTTTTSSTTSTTIPPPSTSPPVTMPPTPQVDLAINSLTLSESSNRITKGEDIKAFILASNAQGSGVDATVALYSDDDLLEAKTVSLGAYEARELEFTIRGARLPIGSHSLKGKILVQGAAVEEINPDDNERSIQIFVKEEGSFLDGIIPILKWVAVGAVVLIVAKIALSFVQGDEEYLR